MTDGSGWNVSLGVTGAVGPRVTDKSQVAVTQWDGGQWDLVVRRLTASSAKRDTQLIDARQRRNTCLLSCIHVSRLN